MLVNAAMEDAMYWALGAVFWLFVFLLKPDEIAFMFFCIWLILGFVAWVSDPGRRDSAPSSPPLSERDKARLTTLLKEYPLPGRGASHSP